MKTQTKLQKQLERLEQNFKTQVEIARELGISDRQYRRIKKSGRSTKTIQKLVNELLRPN